MLKLRTPSYVMYDTLEKLGVPGIDAAPILFTSERSIGGTNWGIKAADPENTGKSWRNKVKNEYEPGYFSQAYFSDFFQSAQTLCKRAVKKKKAVGTFDELAEFLCDDPTADMVEALDNYKLDGTLFANLIAKAKASRNVSAADIASLEMLIFIVTGCLGDLSVTVELAEQFSSRIASRSFKTETATAQQTAQPKPQRPRHLSLVRVEDGAVDLNHPCPLSEGPQGTIIGSAATGASAITNVGDMVSREHARIYLDENGVWYIQGLGSTNGTTLISGSDKKLVVVEPPRKERKGKECAPVPINVNDTIVLAGTTTFIVVVSL